MESSVTKTSRQKSYLNKFMRKKQKAILKKAVIL